MITVKDWMECVNYRISNGSDFQWQCFGPNAYLIESWDGDHEGVSSSVVFNTETQTFFQAEVHDMYTRRSYRYTNPDFIDAYMKECNDRGVDDTAYDGVKFIDLEVEEEFLAKCRAIMNYENYDARVSIPIELEESELLELMKMAHERDITFNEFVEEVLRNEFAKFERNPEVVNARAQEVTDGKSLVE